jgi:hypothetical protein
MSEVLKPGQEQVKLPPTPAVEPATGRHYTPECRLCTRYLYSLDVDLFSYTCVRDNQGHGGYFDYEESPEGRTGILPEKGDAGPDMPCEGKDFDFNPRSPWYKYLVKEEPTPR